MSLYKTPLRYPGGKQRLTPFIIEILEANDLIGGDYIEPYAGGAGVAIELLLGGIVSHIHLNDVSRPVFAFWHSVKNSPDELCHKISRASLTVEEWRFQREIFKNHQKYSLSEVGFATFYLNRCNRSGILDAGVIGGNLQTGNWKMDARFSRNDLIRRIEAIAEKRKFIYLRNWDAEKFINDYIPRLPARSLVYFDPPYFCKGGTLYQNHYKPSDHLKLSQIIQENVSVPWIVSYDSNPNILEYYKRCETFVYSLQYNASKSYKGLEMFAFSDSLQIPQISKLKFINEAIARYK